MKPSQLEALAKRYDRYTLNIVKAAMKTGFPFDAAAHAVNAAIVLTQASKTLRLAAANERTMRHGR